MTKSRKRRSAQWRDYTPATVPYLAIPAGELPGDDQWAHHADWTARMLETLSEEKVKGANAFFTDHGFTSLNDAPIRFVQSIGTY